VPGVQGSTNLSKKKEGERDFEAPTISESWGSVGVQYRSARSSVGNAVLELENDWKNNSVRERGKIGAGTGKE